MFKELLNENIINENSEIIKGLETFIKLYKKLSVSDINKLEEKSGFEPSDNIKKVTKDRTGPSFNKGEISFSARVILSDGEDAAFYVTLYDNGKIDVEWGGAGW